jgi:predicted dehydrogenase
MRSPIGTAAIPAEASRIPPEASRGRRGRRDGAPDSAATSCEAYLPFFLERCADSYRKELDAFVGAVRGDEPCVPDFDDGVQALVFADAALESARTHKIVELTG